MTSRRTRSARSKGSHSEEEEAAPILEENVEEEEEEEFESHTAAEIAEAVLSRAADYTAPGISLGFMAVFVVTAYFHETHVASTSMVLALWAIVQICHRAMRGSLGDDLFWGIVSALGNLAFYLFIGYVWTHAKLYLDVWQGYIPIKEGGILEACLSDDGPDGCFVSFLLNIKWLIVRWMLTWPISMVYTLTRDPFRIATDLAFEWSKRRYLYIIKHAMAAMPLVSGSDTDGSAWILALFAAYIIGYLLIGYAWTHVKLFIDVWQGRLPRKLDEQLRRIYAQKGSYWSFVVDSKWFIMRWVFTWPFSVVHTIMRDPLRILSMAVYKLSQRKYVAITAKAMEWREQRENEQEEEKEEENVE
jgi:hypothetical protein